MKSIKKLVLLIGVVAMSLVPPIAIGQSPGDWLGILLPLGFRISFPVSLFVSNGVTKGAEAICSKFGEIMDVAQNGHSLMNNQQELDFREGVKAQLQEIDKECGKFGFYTEVVDAGLNPPITVRNHMFCYSRLGSARKPMISGGGNPPNLPDSKEPRSFPQSDEFVGLCKSANPEALVIETPQPVGSSYAVLILNKENFKRVFCTCEERYCLGSGECGTITEDGDIIPDSLPVLGDDYK